MRRKGGSLALAATHLFGEKTLCRGRKKTGKVPERGTDTPFSDEQHVSQQEEAQEDAECAATHLFRTRSLCRDGKKREKGSGEAATHLFGPETMYHKPCITNRKTP